jgi:hypothetical protein
MDDPLEPTRQSHACLDPLPLFYPSKVIPQRCLDGKKCGQGLGCATLARKEMVLRIGVGPNEREKVGRTVVWQGRRSAVLHHGESLWLATLVELQLIILFTFSERLRLAPSLLVDPQDLASRHRAILLVRSLSLSPFPHLAADPFPHYSTAIFFPSPWPSPSSTSSPSPTSTAPRSSPPSSPPSPLPPIATSKKASGYSSLLHRAYWRTCWSGCEG